MGARNGTLLALSPPGFMDLGFHSLGFGDIAFMSHKLAPKADHSLPEDVPIPYPGLDLVTHSTWDLSKQGPPCDLTAKEEPLPTFSALSMPPVSAPALGQLPGGRVPADPQTSLNHWQVRALAFAHAIHPTLSTCLHLHSALQSCSTPYAQPGLHKHVQGTPQRAWEEVLASLQSSDEQRKGRRLMGSSISGATGTYPSSRLQHSTSYACT